MYITSCSVCLTILPGVLIMNTTAVFVLYKINAMMYFACTLYFAENLSCCILMNVCYHTLSAVFIFYVHS